MVWCHKTFKSDAKMKDFTCDYDYLIQDPKRIVNVYLGIFFRDKYVRILTLSRDISGISSFFKSYKRLK